MNVFRWCSSFVVVVFILVWFCWFSIQPKYDRAHLPRYLVDLLDDMSYICLDNAHVPIVHRSTNHNFRHRICILHWSCWFSRIARWQGRWWRKILSQWHQCQRTVGHAMPMWSDCRIDTIPHRKLWPPASANWFQSQHIQCCKGTKCLCLTNLYLLIVQNTFVLGCIEESTTGGSCVT